ncbi:lysine transporter LysE [Knoellia sinensis KCTC 19936]|uniref:Lysine transporter LysE n=1 Tax=Knoellia sinensis KCTC 19936 TaxID=1385520 RepID=A0A0A0JA49_9MICO|nr:LysE family translocator [Knoellia sinensis]KGN33664.1 lysine transporter LysE [Knoellia sinensis KCTC 19936]
MSTAFLLTSLVIIATPGTGAIYSVAAGLSDGAKRAVLAAFACTLGIVPHLAAALTGLAALLHTSALAFQTLKYLGIAYLLYMAWGMWHDHGDLRADPDASPESSRRVLITGVVINLLNPKLTLFFFAFLPQFVPAGTPNATWQMLGLSGVFMALTFVVFAAYGVGASTVRQRVLERPRVVRRMRQGFALAFVAMSAKLATASR